MHVARPVVIIQGEGLLGVEGAFSEVCEQGVVLRQRLVVDGPRHPPRDVDDLAGVQDRHVPRHGGKPLLAFVHVVLHGRASVPRHVDTVTAAVRAGEAQLLEGLQARVEVPTRWEAHMLGVLGGGEPLDKCRHEDLEARLRDARGTLQGLKGAGVAEVVEGGHHLEHERVARRAFHSPVGPRVHLLGLGH